MSNIGHYNQWLKIESKRFNNWIWSDSFLTFLCINLANTAEFENTHKEVLSERRLYCWWILSICRYMTGSTWSTAFYSTATLSIHSTSFKYLIKHHDASDFNANVALMPYGNWQEKTVASRRHSVRCRIHPLAVAWLQW